MRDEVPLEGFPLDWPVEKLAALADFITKGTTPTTLGFSWATEGVLFLRSECVGEKGFQLTGSQYIPAAAHAAMARSTVKGGDLLVTITGNCGRVCLYPPGLPDANINQHIARVRVSDVGKVDARFLAYLLSASAYRRNFERIVTGLAYPQLSLVQIRETVVPIPSLFEQRKIAAILSSVDEAIEATQAVIDQLQVVKKAMMAELLTRGLPGRHTRFKQTELGTIPSDWEVKRFDAVCSKIVDGVHKKPDYVKAGVPFVTVKNMTAVEEGISFDDLHYITQADHIGFIRRAHPEPGDVLLTKDGTLGIPRVIETETIFSIFVSVALLKPIRGVINAWFMRFALEAPPIAAHFGIVNAGQALKHIHLVDLRATPCPVPPLEEQEQIVAVLRSVGERIRTERDGALALHSLKAALMSVLLTGELRVTPDPEPT